MYTKNSYNKLPEISKQCLLNPVSNSNNYIVSNSSESKTSKPRKNSSVSSNIIENYKKNKRKSQSILNKTFKSNKEREEDLLKNKSILIKRFNDEKERLKSLSNFYYGVDNKTNNELLCKTNLNFKYTPMSKLGILKDCFNKNKNKAKAISHSINTFNIDNIANINKNNFNDYHTKKFFFKYNIETNEDDFKIFKDHISNPSLGFDYLRKKFPDLKNKKLKNVLYKYNNKFRFNYQAKAIKNDLVAFNINKEADDMKYMNVKNTKLAQVSKLKIKWKTIKWLLENKKDVLDRLVKCQEIILNQTKKKTKDKLNKKQLSLINNVNKSKANNIYNCNSNYNTDNNLTQDANIVEDEGLTKEEFTNLLINNGITNNKELIYKLFWIFDENGDGDLKYSEIAFGVEMFRDSTMEQKLKSFFDLCDVDCSGSISKTEFINLFKKNLINSDEKSSIKSAVDKIFSSVTTNSKGEITYEELKKGCSKHKEIYEIIEKNLMALKSIDLIIDNDIKNGLMGFNPEANEQLRIKLLDQKIVFIPSRDKKFESLIEGLVNNKEKSNENKFNLNLIRNRIDEDFDDKDEFDNEYNN